MQTHDECSNVVYNIFVITYDYLMGLKSNPLILYTKTYSEFASTTGHQGKDDTMNTASVSFSCKGPDILFYSEGDVRSC